MTELRSRPEVTESAARANHVRRPPPARSPASLRLGWRCALIGLTMCVVMVAATVPTPLYTLWSARYGFGALTVTMLFSIYVIGVVIGLFALGGLSDLIGRRPVLLAAIASSALSDIGYLLAHDRTALFVARLVSGLATGLVAGTATAAMVDLAPRGSRAHASIAALLANAGGLASGPAIGGFFAQYLPWPMHLVYGVHLGFLALAAGGTLVALGRGRIRAGAALRPRRLHVPAEIRATFWRASAAGGSGFAVAGVLNAVIGLFLVQLAGVHDLLLAGVIAALVFGTISIGQVAGNRVPVSARLPLACAGLVLGCALNAVSLAYGSVVLLTLAGIIGGTATGLALGHGIAAINTGCPPDRRGETNSAFFAVMYLGLSVPVIGAGLAIASVGLRAGGEIFSAAVAAVVALVGITLLLDVAQHRAPRNTPVPKAAAGPGVHQPAGVALGAGEV